MPTRQKPNIPVWVIALAVLISSAAAADPTSLLSSFVGRWQAEGEAFGAPSSSTMVWTDTAMGGKFFQLDYQINRTTDEGLLPIFAGRAHYRKSTDQQLQAFWIDTNGNLHPVSAIIEGSALVAHWGTVATEQGRTHYQLNEQDILEVTDWVKSSDGWRQFNHTLFTRTKPNS